jgi:hypothetical protein
MIVVQLRDVLPREALTHVAHTTWLGRATAGL